jgi:hypothetical protein
MTSDGIVICNTFKKKPDLSDKIRINTVTLYLNN